MSIQVIPLNLAIQILSGITGSNALAQVLRGRGFGIAGNSAVGVIGGLLGTPALAALLGESNGTAHLIQTAAGSGSGGAALMGVAGFVTSIVRRYVLRFRDSPSKTCHNPEGAGPQSHV